MGRRFPVYTPQCRRRPKYGPPAQRFYQRVILYSVAWPETLTNGVLNGHIQVAETGKTARLDDIALEVGAYDGWYNIQIRPFRQDVIARFTDITVLKKAELLNQQQTGLLQLVLNSSSNTIIGLTAVRDQTTHQIIDFQYTAHNEANHLNMNGADETIPGQTLLTFLPHAIIMGLFDWFEQDRVQMKPLITHLFANALNFRTSDRPATLRIRCRTIAATLYPDLLKSVGTYHEVSFTDNSIGFDDKYAIQIFQVFQRLYNRQQYPRAGVGPAICKRIIENHHGAITATASLTGELPSGFTCQSR